MKISWKRYRVGIAACCLALTGCSWSQEKNSGVVPVAKRLALDEVEAQKRLVVTSLDMNDNQPIPEEFSNYGANKPPRLTVSGGPATTVSYALIMEEPDAPDSPFVHWVVYNMTPADIATGILPPATASVGVNSAGTTGYFGPRPPLGSDPHHYHFQFFAINKKLNLPPGATRDQTVNAFRDHVVAKGALVVTYGK